MTAKNLGPGKHADGQGLWLVKRNHRAGKWILRIVTNGKRREMGLGRWPDVPIAEARDRASQARLQLRDGLDPVQERRQRRQKAHRVTLEEAVKGCFEARKAELKNDGKAGRWRSPLDIHVLPKIGQVPVEDIDQHHVKQVLEPIWHSKADTAAKALNRINLTLEYAAALGLDVDLQASSKARALLGKQRHQVQHIPSMPYIDLPSFYCWLCTQSLTTAKALQFLILTAARTSEVRLATFSEIVDGVWHLSEERTKTGAAHRIPLSNGARDLVSSMPEHVNNPYVFVGHRGKPLSDMAMSSFMKREGYATRPHGFRATFRTWVEEQTDYPFEVKEMALGHAVGSETVRAYQRSDHFAARKTLMEEWHGFCARDVRTKGSQP